MINDLKQRAYEQERSENFGRAIELYESVIDHREAEGLTHQDASVFLRIADLHLRRNQEEEAIEAFQRAGELYAREGLQPQAIAVYRRILRIAPEHTEALWNLAWLHAEMGVMAEARDYVADYLETVDMERDWVEARDFLRRLLDLSEDVAIGLRLAELLEEAGRHDDALDVLERLDVDFGGRSALDEEEIRSRIESIREEVVPDEEQVDGDISFEGAADADETGDAPAGMDEASAATAPGSEFESPSEFDDASADFGEFDDAAGADDLAASGAGESAAGEAGTDEEYDLEVDAGEEGSLDEGFPFPDADEELENGSFDDGGFEERQDTAAADARREQDGASESDDDWSEPGASVDEEPADEVTDEEYGAVADEIERPPASFGDEVAGADEESGAEDEDDRFGGESDEDPWPTESGQDTWETEESEEQSDEQQDEDEEEPMSTHSQDLPGGPAVEQDKDSFESDATGREDSGFGGASTGSGVSDTAGTRDYDEDYGEHAELRRGLDVLDELIELDPDRLDHYRRRVGYARRLDDPGELEESWLEMAETLRRRESSRGARLVYEHVLGLDVDAERARQGIEDLERSAREALDVPDLFPEDDVRSDLDTGASDLGRRVWPELDRLRGSVQWLQGAAEMLRSGEGDGPPAEAYELTGRYFLASDDVDDAIEVLSLALDREDLSDAELTDVLFQLGLSHYRIDDRGSARKYFDRVATHDEDFSTVCDWVLSAA